MIGYITGKVVDRESKEVIILTESGVGYTLFVSAHTAGSMPADDTLTVSLFVETIVREDALSLYGFSSKNERELFRLLNNVNKVGPKLALSILGADSPGAVASAIVNADTAFFKHVTGVGKKTAEKIIIDLQDKVGHLATSDERDFPVASSAVRDAEEALISLGYSLPAVRSALKKVENIDDLSSEQIIRSVLTLMRR